MWRTGSEFGCGIGLTARVLATTVSIILSYSIAVSATAAEPIKIGLLKFAASCPVYVSSEMGYFAREGLEPEIVPFDAAQPVAVAAVAGDIDFGVAALTAGFYNLAGQGALRIIAAQSHEQPGFKNVAYLVSDRAYAAGLRSIRDFPGHTVGITQIGSSYHYAIGLLAEKYGFDLARIRLVPLQSTPAQVAAIRSGQVDTAMLAATAAIPLINSGVVHVVGWVGDETPWQLGAVFTNRNTADRRGAMVERFLRAYISGARDCHDAFAATDDVRRDGPNAPAIMRILSKYTGQPIEQLRLGISYIDRDARLDENDIVRQIAWYKSNDMIKPQVDGDAVIDGRYARPVPAH